ncbi:methyltransferase domain-containing protein [Candidatus Poribacteria bacterium]|nr:methyltransferase domain-containing protein [Candidatus Poribacteria bacterium]
MTNKNLLKTYGDITGVNIFPITALGIRYYDKNYGRILGLIPEDSRILEVGPGGASFTQYLLFKGFKNITVCEISDSSVEALKGFFKSHVRVVHWDAVEYVKQAKARFDFIYAGQFIEHLSRDRFLEFLKICCNVLSPGGHLVLETINCANITYGLYLMYCDYTHMMGFTPRSLSQFVMAVGDFSDISLLNIYPLRLKDAIQSIKYRRRISSELSTKINTQSPSQISTGRFFKLLKIPGKSIKIRISTLLSRVMLGNHEFDGIKIFTPFFALVARKSL